MKDKKQITLNRLERGVQLALTDKVFKVFCEHDYGPSFLAHIISTIGTALGETFERIEYPTNWQRFIKRKDCPKYMKQITVAKANAYYPRLSMPKEKHWLTFDKHDTDLDTLSEMKDMGLEG